MDEEKNRDARPEAKRWREEHPTKPLFRLNAKEAVQLTKMNRHERRKFLKQKRIADRKKAKAARTAFGGQSEQPPDS